MKNLIGIPYKFKGNTEKGIDCYNLVKLYYCKILNKQVKDDISYKNKKDILNIKKIKETQNIWFKVEKIEKGSLLLIRMHNFPAHCGVAINKQYFLHILENETSCIEKISRWKNKIIGIYNLKEEK